MPKGRFTLMGCGGSAGVPMVGNFWGACDPNEPKNRRLRSSALVQTEKTTVLIDTGPDFREQSNHHNVNDFDGILYSHEHADHTFGIPELLVLRRMHKRRMQIYGDRVTLDALQFQFPFVFNNEHSHLYPSAAESNTIEPYKSFTIGDIDIMPYEQDHGTMTSLGYRFGDIAYSTDMKNLDQKAIDTLKGIKTWVVDAGAYNNPDNYVHANIETVYKLNEQIGAEHVYIMHLPVTMDYQTVQAELKEGYQVAYDGLEFDDINLS